MTTRRLTQQLTMTLAFVAGFISTFVHAALPQMDAPSRGEGASIIETLQNYAFDGAGLIALAISVVAFSGVAYHAYGTFAEVQGGKKTWAQFGLTCTVGALLLVLVIWLLTKATGIL